MSVTILHGDCIDEMRKMSNESVDAIVTDPPYGLAFMGKAWDDFAPGDSPMRRSPELDAVNAGASRQGGRQRAGADYLKRQAKDMRAYQQRVYEWALEMERVLKPGGHLLAFGGTRTYHRLACGLEDAGFEIRDSIALPGMLAWVHGQGFPKALNLDNDDSFCWCLRDVRETAPGATAEPTTEVLREGVRQRGPGSVARDGVPRVRRSVDRADAVSSGARGDLFGEMPVGAQVSPAAEACATKRPMPDMLGTVPHAAEPQSAHAATAVPGMQRNGASERGAGTGASEVVDARSGKPGVEGRRDVQAPEGQLQGRDQRPVPSVGEADDDAERLHHGAPARDGGVVRPTPDANGSGEPHQPRPTRQPQGEPRTLPGQPDAQARGVWPLCRGCGKPRITPGLSTALKPAWEAIVVARKRLAGTVAATVAKYGTGALNVDESRVGTGDGGDRDGEPSAQRRYALSGQGFTMTPGPRGGDAAGRWPPNLLLSHAPACIDGGRCAEDCAVAEMDRQSGVLTSGALLTHHKRSGESKLGTFNIRDRTGEECDFGGDSGGASRFFPVFRYEAKPSRAEREIGMEGRAAPGGSIRDAGGAQHCRDAALARNHHPTVKPIALMAWLVQLVTPKGGVVLDPFLGSGTTAIACQRVGLSCIGIEKEAEYVEIARARVRGDAPLFQQGASEGSATIPASPSP